MHRKFFKNSVNRTCEGLKPVFRKYKHNRLQLCESNLWGIETCISRKFINELIIRVNRTCEGLKRSNGILFPVLVKICVNRTCEGLKRCIQHYPLDKVLMVWIEPVRDWNSFNSTCAKSGRSCVNRTCEGLKQTSVSNDLKKLKRVNRTCEGLKHFSHRISLRIKECESNLWGIETKKCGSDFRTS